ncbi:hypothetical protein [Rhizobium sp. BK376]|jgi:hypothetical protein|uniref:hypothetical protein n=1 Tax=Rhizobium sp. BK376 TaxID=2512149 RepID=UPI0010513492|nr:hypothetical protein [Rhizobium sp. BK376]TCR91970.1 hypothetical protein EV561_102414 [Rhizobium sp. BK376]
MGRGNTSDRPPDGAAQRGLWRLMLKLPSIRGELQMFAARNRALDDLCEAYEDASVTLERIRKKPGDTDYTLVREYETICTEIETEVIKYCVQHRQK